MKRLVVNFTICLSKDSSNELKAMKQRLKNFCTDAVKFNEASVFFLDARTYNPIILEGSRRPHASAGG